jgi:uncharacterized protein (TIGR02996 family)
MTADPALAAFVARMRDHPADDVVRLACADWFEERGEAGRAEFVRVQVELAKMPPQGPRRTGGPPARRWTSRSW